MEMRMTVEEVLSIIYHFMLFKSVRFDELVKNQFYKKFVPSVNNRIHGNKPLSSEQAKTILKLIKLLENNWEEIGLDPIRTERLLISPKYKNEPYASRIIKREVRYLGDNKLGFRFKRTDELYEIFKDLLKNDDEGYYNFKEAIWCISITRKNIESIMNIISNHLFDFDDEVVMYLTKCANSKGTASIAAYDPESNKIVINVSDNPFLVHWIKHILEIDPA